MANSPAFQKEDRVMKTGGRYGGPGRVVGVNYLGDGYYLYGVAMRVEGGYGEFVHVFPESVLTLASDARAQEGRT